MRRILLLIPFLFLSSIASATVFWYAQDGTPYLAGTFPCYVGPIVNGSTNTSCILTIVPACNSYITDINNDTITDIKDLAIFAKFYGKPDFLYNISLNWTQGNFSFGNITIDSGPVSAADYNANGVVDLQDLTCIALHWHESYLKPDYWMI